jgi:PAS domain S-box-containing protein
MALRESELFTRTLLETAAQGILAIDRAGAIRIVNIMVETMFGYKRDDLLGRPLEILLPELFRKHHAALRDGYFSEPRNRAMGLDVELEGRRQDGTTFPVEISLSHVETKEERLAVCFISDISERKRAHAVSRNQQDLQALTASLIATQEEEHKHVARELHDVFSHKLAVLGLDVSRLSRQKPGAAIEREELQKLSETIQSLTHDIHRMSRQLHPSILDDLGLAAALKQECAIFSELHNIPVSFTAGRVPASLPANVSLCLYRVAQEALRNVGQHAAARQVHVALKAMPDDIALRVRDNGNGFGPGKPAKKGLGLVSMEERVRLVNGTFRIESLVDRGTEVEVHVPLKRNGRPRP